MATNNNPANTLRCGNIKATIWRNSSHKVPFSQRPSPARSRINPEHDAMALRSVSINLEALISVGREAKEWISTHALKH